MNPDIRICYMGDSFVNGTCDPQMLGWTGRLSAASQTHLDAEFTMGRSLMPKWITHYNLGIRRETSIDILARWEAETEARFRDGSDNRVVFSFGANDTTMENGKQRVTTAKSVAATIKMLSIATEQYPTLMVGPLPLADHTQNQRTVALDEKLQRACRAIGVPYLTAIKPLMATPTWMAEVAATDGAHPGAAGYAALADLVKRWEYWWF